MCGIIGVLSSENGIPPSSDEFLKARDRLTHRGPDDAGVWLSASRKCLLGHRRLSIIDLSSDGHQPIFNEERDKVLVFNGEIYNFHDLRMDLVSRGHQFRSHTDTEVIIHGYEEYGAGIVEKLRGMFAIALYDSKKDELFIARDRLGVKPLYYSQAGSMFAFASELKALLELPGVEKKIDQDSVGEYLYYGKVHSPKTMFSDIYKFPAGHHAIVKSGKIVTSTKYWTPFLLPGEAALSSESDYVGHLYDLIDESVRLRMVSDVPVGVFLSGGVDSTLVTALIAKNSSNVVSTYTAGFKGQSAFDEREWAAKAAGYYGTNHTELEISRDQLIDALPRISFYLDEPTADPTVVPLYFLSEQARKNGSIVIINGDGSDELFCGYSKWQQYLKLLPYWNAYNVLPHLARKKLYSFGKKKGISNTITDFLGRSVSGLPLFIGGTSPLKGTDTLEKFLSGDRKYDLDNRIKMAFKKYAEESGTVDEGARWMSYWGLASEVEEIFMYRADRIGMAHSIEIREPFLDHKLIEFAMQMPQELKYKNNTGKYILKKAAEKIVPHEFLYRKKQGFCVPVGEWAGGMMSDEILAVLPHMEKDCDLFSKENIRSISSLLSRKDDGHLAWHLYSLSTWYKQWFL